MKRTIIALVGLALLCTACASEEDEAPGPEGPGDAGLRDRPASLRDLPSEGEAAGDAGELEEVSDGADRDVPEIDGQRDLSDSGGESDPCAGLSACEAAGGGSRCDGTTVVTCEQSFEGCWFETRHDCASSGQQWRRSRAKRPVHQPTGRG